LQLGTNGSSPLKLVYVWETDRVDDLISNPGERNIIKIMFMQPD